MFAIPLITLGLQKALQGKLGRPSIHAWSAPRFMGDSSSIHDHCCSACRQAGQILDSCPACPSIHGLCTGLPVPRFMPGLPLDSWPASWADPRFMDSALSSLCLDSCLASPSIHNCSDSLADPRFMDSELCCLYLGSLLIFPWIMAALPAS